MGGEGPAVGQLKASSLHNLPQIPSLCNTECLHWELYTVFPGEIPLVYDAPLIQPWSASAAGCQKDGGLAVSMYLMKDKGDVIEVV